MPEYFCEEWTEMSPEELQQYLNRKAREGFKLHTLFRLSRNNYEVVLCKETISEAMKKLHSIEDARRAEQNRIKQEWSELPWWKKMLRRL